MSSRDGSDPTHWEDSGFVPALRHCTTARDDWGMTMGRFTYDSTKRIDRLATHVALTASLLERGAVASGIRYQLELMRRVIDDVLSDEKLSDQTWICRELDAAG